MLYFRDGIEQEIDVNDRILGKDKRYSVSLTPVDFISSYIDNGKYNSISSISSENFLVPQYANSINYPYVNFEVHQMKNSSFYVARSLINNGMLSSNHLNLMQYYVTGYRSSLTRSYVIADCIVINL